MLSKATPIFLTPMTLPTMIQTSLTPLQATTFLQPTCPPVMITPRPQAPSTTTEGLRAPPGRR